MDKKSVFKITGIVLAFFILGFGYLYFQRQALLSSGRTNTDSIATSLNDGDSEYVKTKLSNYVGEVSNNDLELAKTNIDYLTTLISANNQLSYVDGQVAEVHGESIYSGVYSIKSDQGGKDYLLIVMDRQDGQWILSNTKFSATNPFAE